MLIINKKFAIKTDHECFALCRKKREDYYQPTNYFPNLETLVIYMIDNSIIIPKKLEILAKSIKTLKDDVNKALKAIKNDGIER